jgi:WD40 repeat protein
MARIRRHCQEVAAAFAVLAALFLAPSAAQDQGQNAGTDLYDHPVLAVDPGMHTATIWSQSVDGKGQYAITGSADNTVKVWSVVDGKLLRTIRIPVGPDPVGTIFAVAISPDGSTIAAGGWTEQLFGDHPIYLFDRESGTLIRRIRGDLPDVTKGLAFSPEGRYLVATLGRTNGIRVFDRDRNWRQTFRDDGYARPSGTMVTEVIATVPHSPLTAVSRRLRMMG